MTIDRKTADVVYRASFGAFTHVPSFDTSIPARG